MFEGKRVMFDKKLIGLKNGQCKMQTADPSGKMQTAGYRLSNVSILSFNQSCDQN